MFNIHKDLSILPIYLERYNIIYKRMVNEDLIKDDYEKEENNTE